MSFGTQVKLEFHFCQVFGDTRVKIRAGWEERGGFAGYNRHVLSVASRLDHVRLRPGVWTKNPPSGSVSPHLFIEAVSQLESTEQAAVVSAEAMAWAVRRAFFEEARDVGSRQQQLLLAEALEIDRAALQNCYDNGLAHAALARDIDLARKHDVTMSPTRFFNEGRQRLNGNVGFLIIEANLRELLRAPEQEASWC